MQRGQGSGRSPSVRRRRGKCRAQTVLASLRNCARHLPRPAALLDGGQAEPELSSLRSENAGGAFPDSTPQPGSDLAFACPLFDGIAPGEYFYFTHSFIAPTGSHTIAETTHSVRFTSAVQFGERAFGVQFHPEKSSDAGARVLANFVAIAARG